MHQTEMRAFSHSIYRRRQFMKTSIIKRAAVVLMACTVIGTSAFAAKAPKEKDCHEDHICTFELSVMSTAHNCGYYRSYRTSGWVSAGSDWWGLTVAYFKTEYRKRTTEVYCSGCGKVLSRSTEYQCRNYALGVKQMDDWHYCSAP